MKMVMVIDKELPVGVIANSAAVLGISLAGLVGGLVGEDVCDADGYGHRGITKYNIPILGGAPEQLKQLRGRLFAAEYADVIAVDFNDVAQQSRDYDTYRRRLAGIEEERVRYLAVGLYGPLKKINKLTGSLGLLR